MHSVFSLGIVFRFGAYLALWIILIGFSVTNFAVGLPAAALATWISVLLLPMGDRQVSATALARLAMRLPWQSLVAGADVARRALDPRMPLQPGFITYATGLESGPRRNAFRALLSLQPGTLPGSADESGDVLIHCLDTSQPVATQLSIEEERFAQVSRGVRRSPSGNG
jgi:multicomponent Na+:H+ antiporter subunit E